MLSNFHESDLKSANPQENNDNESMTFAYQPYDKDTIPEIKLFNDEKRINLTEDKKSVKFDFTPV